MKAGEETTRSVNPANRSSPNRKEPDADKKLVAGVEFEQRPSGCELYELQLLFVKW